MDESQLARLSAYLDGDLSPREIEVVERELAASEALRDALEELRSVRDWMHGYPGREPLNDVWPEVLSGMTAREDAGATVDVPEHQTWGRRLVARLSSIPPFGGSPWPTPVRRLGIATLVAIAMFGMGRQVYLEQRASHLEETNRLRDLEILQLTSDASWSYNAVSLRGRDGQMFAISCPRFGRAATVWGTGTYTDDSSVCTAAVHSGLIDFDDGGVVTIEIQPGQPSYQGTVRNGVETREYGSWSGSFVFVGDDTMPVVSPEAEWISWSETARELRGFDDTRLTFQCPPGGDAGTVWGSETYTDDSSICTAAVHAGIITFEDGGTVTIEVLPGLPRYRGLVRHGIETRSFGSWSGSFGFVQGDVLVEELNADEPEWIDWEADASDLRGMNGFRVTLACPADGEADRVWGTEVYTDDSSICTAAVHEGLITLRDGGIVVVEVQPGLSAYEGSTTNGVESLDYGRWSGSFRFVTP